MLAHIPPFFLALRFTNQIPGSFPYPSLQRKEKEDRNHKDLQKPAKKRTTKNSAKNFFRCL